jgi:hypothetical protein
MRHAWRLLACSTIFVAGCSIAPIANHGSAPANPSPASASPIQGTLHGGQQPIAFAQIYLLAVGTNGYGNSSTSLLSGTGHVGMNGWNYVLTDANGAFNIPATDYNSVCSGKIAYLYSSGGDTIAKVQGPSNPFAGLMALLGDCSNWNLPATIQFNEVSTVLTAYTLGGFSIPATYNAGVPSAPLISGPSGAPGVINAVGLFNQLYSLSGGVANSTTTNGKGLVPVDTIHALANSIAACINTDGSYTAPGGSLPKGSPCYELMNDALASGNSGAVPSDTASAVINIAHYPGRVNVADIYGIHTAQCGCFTTQLTSAPNDWTVGVAWDSQQVNPANYIAGTDLAIDGSGNIFVTESGNPGDIVKVSSLGVPSGSKFTGNGMKVPNGIAVDLSGNVWVSNLQADVISGFTSSGATTPGQITDTALSGLVFKIAFDGSGNLWAADPTAGNFLEFDPSTKARIFDSDNLTNKGGLNDPFSIAFQPGTLGALWVSDAGSFNGTTVSSYTNAGSNTAATPNSPYTATGMISPHGIAIDGSGHVWTSNYGNTNLTSSSVSRFNSDGTSSATYTGGGVSNATYGGAYDIAIDGLGNVWTANYGLDSGNQGGSISELDNNGNALSPNPGFQYGPGTTELQSIGVDGGGNVWVVVNGGNGGLLELVGAAAPVVTPLSVATKNNQLATRP